MKTGWLFRVVLGPSTKRPRWRERPFESRTQYHQFRRRAVSLSASREPQHDGVDYCSECCRGSHGEWDCPCAEHRRYGIPIAQLNRIGGFDGKAAARPLNDTIMLISVSSSVAAPALIRPIYDADGRTASGLATWQSGGSVLFTSSDCTNGAHVYSSPYAGARAATQVQTPAGIVLYVGAIGTAITVAVHSILYDNGCSQVTVQQNGLLPVLVTMNLSTAFPPPLSFR